MGLFSDKKILPEFLISEDGNTIVVFIHGLLGSRHTWFPFTTKLKKEWILDKSYNLHYENYYQRDYFNPLLNLWGFNHIYNLYKGHQIDDLAIHLDTTLRTVCSGHNHVIIVGHSMGGLVARKYLVEKLNRDKTLGNVRALITYATPHKGSLIANRVGILINYAFNSFKPKFFKQIQNLTKAGDFIENLNAEWDKYQMSDRLNFLRVVGMNDWVVDIDSAMLKLDKRNTFPIADKDHFSIIKPSMDYKDNAFSVTYDYLVKFDTTKEYKEELEVEDTDNNEENKYDF